MGDLYFCERPLAETPYHIRGISLNIYSIEELCYYILHNGILLDPSFMSEGLCRWIGECCGYSELASTLQELLAEGCSLAEFIRPIIISNGYCSNREVEDILYTLHQMESKSDFEKGKIRADKLLENRHYISSIYEYQRLIRMTDAPEHNGILLGAVWHNLGYAYANMLLFEAAAECYETAYKLNLKRASLREMLLSLLCNGQEEEFERKCLTYHVDSRTAELLRAECSRARDSEAIRSFDVMMDRIEAEKMPDHKEYQQQIGAILQEWKEEYRRFCRL